MDPAAYLRSQGWRGDGHALHHSGRGITKAISVAKKSNVFGIGKKQHDAHADQWWARAFDDTLKGLNTTKDEATGNTRGISLGTGAKPLQKLHNDGKKWGGQCGLYSNFVRGESMGGTLEPNQMPRSEVHEVEKKKIVKAEVQPIPTSLHEKTSKKTKRKHRNVVAGDSEVEKIKPPHELSAVEDELDLPKDKRIAAESKEERRQRRKEKREKKAMKENARS